MTRHCPDCSAEVIPRAKYCVKCGCKLAAIVSFQEPAQHQDLSRLQRYLPEGLAQKILSQKERIQGEMRQVTVMFCDMEGFTPLAEKIGPEGVYGLMDKVYEILIHAVNAYEGTVNELTGDGIMALFGAPIALEDAPQRAVRAAIGIHKEITRFSEHMTQEKGFPPIRMRIGINSGPVVVGTVGNNLRVEFKALGDTVNLASRLQTLAEPGTTLVAQETFQLTEGFFRFENLGERPIKGKSRPVRVYQVLAASSRRTRFDVSAERGLTPLIGRERELEILHDAFVRAKSGRGQVVSIVAEAGLGKSRLLYEFRKSIANEDVTFLEGRCLSYSKTVSYHPIVDMLKSFFQISDDDQDSNIRKVVDAALNGIGMDPATAAPYLFELLGVRDSGIDKIMISPQGLQERVIDTLSNIVVKGSQVRPLVLAIEDMHWADQGSTETVTQILENIPAEKVLVILTHRPQFTPGWSSRSYHYTVMLSRLSDRESFSMAAYLLESDRVQDQVNRLLVEKTDGIPFFIEEFARSLLALGIICRHDDGLRLNPETKGLRLPSTIQDIIMSRVDVLPESAREILRIGSAIEREFDYHLLKMVSVSSEDELTAGIAALREAEFIYQRGVIPDATFIFRHALTLETLHGSMLTAHKKELHRKIGEALEALYADRTDEHCDALTRHFTECDLHDKVSVYATAAAKRARRSGSYEEAIAYSEICITALEQIPVTEVVQKKIIDARSILSSYLIVLSRHGDAKKAVDPIVDTAVSKDYQENLPSIFIAIGSYWWAAQEFEKALHYLHLAHKKAHQKMDWYSYWQSSQFLAVVFSCDAQFAEALKYFQICLELSHAANNMPGISFVNAMTGSFALAFQGKISSAYTHTTAAIRASESCIDAHIKGVAHSSHGMVCFFKGEFVEAIRFLKEAIKLNRKSGNDIWKGWADFWLAQNFYHSGKYKEAQHYFRETILTFKNRKDISVPWESFHKLCLQKADMASGEAVRNFCPAFYRSQKVSPWIEGLYLATIARTLILSGQDRWAEAESLLNDAIATDERYGTRWSLGQDHAALSELHQKKGDHASARHHLKRAIEIMQECGADGWVERYQKTLSEIK
jgi:class 3 adenylate cyclase/tetratricopeptide (TPR) repeat protein